MARIHTSDSNVQTLQRVNVPTFLRGPFIAIAIILVAAGLARATTVVIPSDDQLIVESRAIIRARVLSVTTSFDAGSGRVFTYVKLRVRAVFKGDIRSSEIVVKQFGGQAGDHITMLYGAPRFAVGEAVFLFLDTSSDGTLRVHDEFLGKYSLVRSSSGKLMVTRSVAEPGVHVAPQGSTVDATWQMDYSAYIEKLRGKITTNMVQSVDYEDKYFRGVPVLSEPREYRNQLKTGGLQPEFHTWPGSPVRWFQPDSGQPVTYLINLDQAPTGAQADVDAAMGAWSNVSGCAMRVVDGGSTTNCEQTGVGVASFDNCEGFFSGGGTCQSILAEGGWNGSFSNTKIVNGVTFGQITEGFLSFNPFASCFFSGSCNVEEIATHEMGHSLGMGHSWDPGYPGSPTAAEADATMYYIAHFDGRCAHIHSDDIAGITFIYPGSTSSSTASTIGLYSPSGGAFFLRYSNTSGVADNSFSYGPASVGWIALAGDWNGGGIVTPGLYNPASGAWFLRNSNSTGTADMTFSFGPANLGWIPIVGDWDGNGTTTVGLYDPVNSVFFLRNSNSSGVADITFSYGPGGAGWLPVAGHWNGVGPDTIGLYDPSTSTFFLRNSNTTGVADITFAYGPANAGWLPAVGDWDGNGTDTVGLFAPAQATWFLRNSNTTGVADITFAYGFASGAPLTGRWH
jgi:hypothetical protein